MRGLPSALSSSRCRRHYPVSPGLYFPIAPACQARKHAVLAVACSVTTPGIASAPRVWRVTRLFELSTIVRQVAATRFGITTRVAPLSAEAARTPLAKLTARA